MSDFFWILYSQHQFNRLGHADGEASRALGRATNEMERLRDDVDRLTLATAAMWSLLKAHGHSEAELLERMQELDLRDGKLDGKLVKDVQTCGKCGRRSRGRRNCLYCGHELSGPKAFGTEP